MEESYYLFYTPENLIRLGGVIIILSLVFVETGLLLGLILPGGETLIFTAGLLSGVNVLSINFFLLLILMVFFSILGDLTGYYLGRKWGSKLYNKKDSFLFKKKYLDRVEDFYNKHGNLALILGKFLPVVRTFNPVFSGTINLEIKKFLLFTGIACLLYVSGLSLLGYFLGKQFPEIKDYLSWILPIMVLLFIIPIIFQFIKSKK